MLRVAAITALVAATLQAAEPYAPAVAGWNRPVEPVKIVGNLYYVGASDVSAYLIATPEGHILLDTGFAETVPLVEANMKKLGFRLEDIKLLLITHAHYDHAGGVAEVKRRTQARLLTSPAEAPLLARGGKGDFAFGGKFAFPPAQADGLLRDGEPVRLGTATMTPHFTPGHTKGCTSWSVAIRDGGKDHHVVLPCSLTAPGYKLIGNTQYPGIVSDFESSIATLRKLPCDIFAGSHSWDFDLHRKLREAAAGQPAKNPFLDPEGYRKYVDKGEAAIRKAVAEQRGGKSL